LSGAEFVAVRRNQIARTYPGAIVPRETPPEFVEDGPTKVTPAGAFVDDEMIAACALPEFLTDAAAWSTPIACDVAPVTFEEFGSHATVMSIEFPDAVLFRMNRHA
jgi:hypothetical protein